MDKLNPRICTVEYGARELKDMKVYPLAIADQITMGDLITKALKKFYKIGDDAALDNNQSGAGADNVNQGESVESMNDIEFISFIIDMIKSNIAQIIKLTTDFDTEEKANGLLADITNDQVVVFASKIYEMNYEGPVKNAVSLLKKVMLAKAMIAAPEATQTPTSPLKRPSQPSSSDTQGTDLSTSLGSPSKKGD